jgi:magnesium transporter
LKGVISIKEIHSSKKDAHIEDAMTKKLVFAHPLTDQERIVYLALSNGIKSIPIVDRQKHLLGIVPFNVILNVFNEEVREDTFKFGGIFHKVGKEFTTIKASAATMIKTRIPWLMIGVLGGTVTASIITNFENVLNILLALAAFAPVLAYLSDAVGTQSETLAVRSIALDPKLSLKSYFLREFAVAIVLALVCGGLLSTVALFGWQDPILGLIVGVSMFLSIIAAVFFSTGFPFVFKKVNLDPAVASGPFATMISDVATMTIYFAIASLLLVQFGLM